MAKQYCHINQCNSSVQYFAILHSVTESHNTKNTFTLTFTRKNKRRSTMRQGSRQKIFVAELLCSATKKICHTIKAVVASIPQNIALV